MVDGKIPQTRRRWRRARRGVHFVAGFAGVLVVLTWISTDQFRGFGGTPEGAFAARVRASSHFRDGEFKNVDPTQLMKSGSWEATKQWFFGSEMRAPICPLPIFPDTARRLAHVPPSGLRITWLGHSTTLIEIDDTTLLTDPQWSEHASPSRWLGPTRFHPPPLPIEALPRIDAVLVSHEHFDHLDMATIQSLSKRGTVFHVPLGVGPHMRLWEVPLAQIVEHDWGDRAKVGTIEIVSTPARHFNGRGLPWRTGSFWTSWAAIGPRHRVFFSGDTGLSETFRETAEREGPFDVALLEIGQWHPSWGDIHLGPRGALEAFARLRAKHLFPIHWSTFQLAMHSWSEPAETLFTLAAQAHVSALMPRLGEPVEPSEEGQISQPAWWRTLPPIAPRCP